jgi:Lecithin retinol acyltransferase
VPDWGHLNAGDHLRVKRRLGYYHHGIYAGDDRVVQFGGGIKPNARIEEVDLASSRTAASRRSWTTAH